jgi:uncharacterized membrane protein (DUF441 family)
MRKINKAMKEYQIMNLRLGLIVSVLMGIGVAYFAEFSSFQKILVLITTFVVSVFFQLRINNIANPDQKKRSLTDLDTDHL